MSISISSNSGTDLLKQLLAQQQAAAASSTVDAGQISQGSDATSAAPAGPPPGAPPPKPEGAADQRFSADTLSALISSQSGQSPADALASKLVASADTDGDGELSTDEITAALGKAGDTTDTNSVAAAVKSLDTNGDGQLSTSEIASGLQQAHAGRAGGHHHHHHGGAPPASADAPTSASATASSILGADDTDASGALSLDEVTQALSQSSAATASTSPSSTDLQSAFASLDTNGDGQLSASELTSALQSFLTAQSSFGVGADPASTRGAGISVSV